MPHKSNLEKIQMAIGLIHQVQIELGRVESGDPNVFDPVFLCQRELLGIAEDLRVAAHFEKSNARQ